MQDRNLARAVGTDRGSSLLSGTRSWTSRASRASRPCFSRGSFCSIWPHLPLQVGLALFHTMHTPATPCLSPARPACTYYRTLPLLMRFLPSAWNVFHLQRCLAKSYSSFKTKVKCHFFCNAFSYFPRLIPHSHRTYLVCLLRRPLH